MNKQRRKFLAEIVTIAGISAVDGFGLSRTSSASEPKPQQGKKEISRNLADYPHITDVVRSKNVNTYFPLLVSACADPNMNYLANIPFLIELEVCKIWKESAFEWDAISYAGAGGLQQIMDFTARGLGLVIADSTELREFNSASAENKRLEKEISSKGQSIYTLVNTGSETLAQDTIDKINDLRKEIGELSTKKELAYNRLREARSSYSGKIRSLSKDELLSFDARFVPEKAIPAGTKHITDIILACKNYFGGPIEINVWRGLAAYNAGLQSTKNGYGMPFIRETILYTRDIVFNLSKMMELKYVYTTNDSSLIANTKNKFK